MLNDSNDYFKISSTNSYGLEPFDNVLEQQRVLYGDRFRD